MHDWVLIILMTVHNGGSAHHVPFATEAACNSAVASIRATAKKVPYSDWNGYTCVPTGATKGTKG